MKKAILAWTVLACGIAFTACRSDGEPTTEERLRSLYGWKGESLPAPAPNPDPNTETPLTEKTALEEGANGKEAGIVSTVEKADAVSSGSDKANADTPAKTDAVKAGAVKHDNTSVKGPSILKNEAKPTKFVTDGETRTYIVKPGDSLWSIAANEYKSGYKWGILYRANKELLKGKPDSIRPGMKLVVPVLKQKQSASPEVPAKPKAAAQSPAKAAGTGPAEETKLPSGSAAPAASQTKPAPAGDAVKAGASAK